VQNLEADIEKKILLGYTAEPTCELHCLVIACDLKRNRKTIEPPLDKYITDLFAKLYLRCGDFEVLAKPTKESKLTSKVMQRTLAITKIAGKDKGE
jgi:DNA repair ATPase RecN